MQTVKEKLSDMATMRKIKSDAKAEEQAEKDVAKTRVEVAKEIRKAKEAEAEMDLHVAKVGEKVQKYVDKHPEAHHDHIAGIPTSEANNLSSENVGYTNTAGATDTTAAPTSNNYM